MREIKFRVWNIERKEMRQGYNFMIDGMGGLYWQFGCDEPRPLFSAEHEVMQFTGLKDKNGKEIYEGDIVRQIIVEGHEWSGLHEVIFYGGAFMIRGGNPHGMRYGEPFNWYPQNVEVIGNIYENPSLLGKGE